MRILLVEDNLGDERLIRETLAASPELSAEICVVHRLEEATERLAEGARDVVLLDLGLPDSQGLDTLRRVLEVERCSPIVVLTGVDDLDVAREAIREGAQDYLPKGALSAELLNRTIRHAIERMRIQRELDDERDRLFRVLDALPMFVHLHAPDFTIPFANKTFHDLFGETEKRPCHEVFHGWAEPCEECPPMRVQETGEAETSEWTSAAGRTYAIYDQIFPGSGDSPLTLEVGLDITEQRAAQEELAESEDRYRRLFENMMDGFALHEIVVDDAGEPIDYVFLEVNSAFERLTGLRRENLIGKRVTDALPGTENDPADWIGRYGRVALTGEETRFEQRSEPLDKWFSVVAFSPRRGRFATIFEDITERKRAEAAVTEWKNRYEGAVSASRHVLYDWDSDTNYATYGGDLERILGYTAAEISGPLDRWTDLIHPDDRPGFDEAIARLLKTHEPAHLQYRVRRKDGRYIHIEDDGSFIPDSEGRTVRMLGFVRDVTEQRLVAERIEASERRYRAVFELAPTGIVTIDLKGILTSCNRAFAQMAGYDVDELVGMHFSRLPPVRAGDAPKYLRLFRSIFVGRPIEPFKASWTRKDGTVRDGEVRVSLLRWEGKLLGIQVIVEDVTDRLAAEADLRESEIRYRSLFEDAILGIYQTTPDGRILAANPALVRMLGYDSFEELAERDLEAEGYEPETPRAQFKEHLERLGSFIGRESAWKRRDGTTIYVRENARVVRDAAGRVLYYEGTIEDVTEKRRAELEAEALRTQLELTQYSVDSTDAVVLWVRPDGSLTFVNDAACRMLGYMREELLEMAVWDIDTAYSKEGRVAAWDELKERGTEVSESVFRRKDGGTFPVEITAQYLEFRGRELEFAVAFDISDRKQLEAQLRQSQKLESVGTLASGVAHEINNPLTGIINYAQLISDRVGNPKLREYADGIHEEGLRVAKIVRNLLSFSRHEQEHHRLARVIDIVDASLSLFATLLRRDGIALDVDVPEDLPMVSCRTQEMQQVVINLLANARDSLNLQYPDADAGKRLTLRARIHPSNGRKWLRLSVIDRGGGIQAEILDRVFDPFFTTKPRDQGTGLGLSVSYGLVRDHGGRMTVESEPGEGAAFHVDLPL
jgi:PAS domain S-box-containing protein